MPPLVDVFMTFSPMPLYRTTSKVGKISDVESALGRSLPEGYRTVLENFPFGAMFGQKLEFPAIDPTPWAVRRNKRDSFDFFFGLKGQRGTVMDKLKTYSGRVPDKFLPFGESSGGNLLCLSLREDSYDAVYFWDHENEVDAKGLQTPESSNIYLVANSFQDFVLSLIRIEDGNDDDDFGIESITLRI